MNIELEKVKLDHQRLDHDLDLILGQQTELEEVLKPLEENVAQQAATYSQQQPQHADLERENMLVLLRIFWFSVGVLFDFVVFISVLFHCLVVMF